ncbi:phosphoinositide 3-kinase adapter protein 1-like isoform X1 [Sinocyclocheilus rhinocerous]|uniref:phosphoinositide 3-kinase adapter protein 1-like isoform X1 n=1 Tax=Sinocyclocheilus rhinocerous TaxID=307959 RepID=UPI0007B82602|nr:PREDICTED: phosphoinositide 3-kinase adapter protein 1-like isoform X1 [Sinocyclocheilus rhinocerous]XP_016412304.1 PREDICTED: phosphoinositide 3-kinase adapter protein 1-like isoform X1 [Sinocyclocheilus rhinocerous]
MCEVLIVHTSEAREWAEYLQQILVASCNFLEGSLILYDVNEEIWMKNHELFGSSKCIMLLLSAVFLDMQHDPEVQDTFRDLLQPPCKVVAFLCGISERQVSADYFEHWEHWRKLNSEDEPSVYVSTVLECIDNGSVSENGQNPYEIELEEQMNAFLLSEIPETLPDEMEHIQVIGDDVCHTEQTSSNTMGPLDDQTCLTIQPDRILCGNRVNIYIIMVKKIVDEGRLEVEFHSQYSTPQRIPGTLVNEYIVTVQSPDMPAGKVSLTLYKNESVACSTTVTYYTEMEEICRYLKKAMDPMQFMCQAFDITSKVPESLDNLLADSLEERMPLNGLQVFGISQIADNTPANHRNVELPTLLHFSAKYGLKKLTSLLMRCPGAMQAYSVMNKDGDYPNKLAEKSGFSDLRQFMDEYVETVDLVKTHMEESQNTSGNEDIYEDMLMASQNFITSFDNEDIYESMMKLNPEMGLYDDLESALEDSKSETILRKFFEAQPDKSLQSLEHTSINGGLPEMDDEEYHDMGLNAEIYGDVEEEDPYNPCCPDQIYDTVEPQSTSEIINRPPAPIPRPANLPEPEENTTYISKVFCLKEPVYSLSQRPERDSSLAPVRLVRDRDMSSHHDPFAGMKTPGQRQLISLQERVKVGELTVEEAVQEFKAWQFDQDKRWRSLRFQQENLQRLRDSITRRCKGKGPNELMITAPMQINSQWGSQMNMNCSVYEPTPRSIAQPPPVSRPLQRGSWQTGSNSSTSSSSSHRLSTQSTVSNSSEVEGECEEPPDIPLPPRPLRPVVDTPPVLPPPRVPPRVIERNPDILNERYVSTPSRPVHQTPAQRSMPPPPIPRRTW